MKEWFRGIWGRRLMWFIFLIVLVLVGAGPLRAGRVAHAVQGAAHTEKVAIGGCLDHSCFDRDPVGLSKQPVYCTDPNYPNADDTGNFLSYISIIYDREGKELAWFRDVYSDACKANWVYGVLIDGTRLKMTITANKKDEAMMCDPADCTSYLVSPIIGWSNMVDGTGLTVACAYTTANDLKDHGDYSACIKR